MRRIMIKVAYDGTNYCGWQVQPNGITIEEVLNRTLTKVLKEKIQIIGASRTDSGVHALGNIAVFDTKTNIPSEKIAAATNQRLPEDILIIESKEVEAGFHPRYTKSVKTYEYHIVNSSVKMPDKRLTNSFVSYKLDIENMKKAAKYLVGEHDFASFCSIRTNTEDTVRTVYEIEIQKKGEDISILITGNGFLYNMVRIIVGTLIRVGRGFYKPEEVKEILEKRDRKAAGQTAEAKGLFLVNIEYLK